MLKITLTTAQDCSVTLRLEGRIIGPWVAELANRCEEALTEASSLSLHLADVDFMDPPGVALLASLRSRGVEMRECPPFVEAQLQAWNQTRPGARRTVAGNDPGA